MLINLVNLRSTARHRIDMLMRSFQAVEPKMAAIVQFN